MNESLSHVNTIETIIRLNKTIQTDANRTITNLDKNIAGLYEV